MTPEATTLTGPQREPPERDCILPCCQACGGVVIPTGTPVCGCEGAMILPKQAPPVIRPAPPRWQRIGNYLCPVIRTDRDYRAVTPSNPTRPSR